MANPIPSLEAFAFTVRKSLEQGLDAFKTNGSYNTEEYKNIGLAISLDATKTITEAATRLVIAELEEIDSRLANFLNGDNRSFHNGITTGKEVVASIIVELTNSLKDK